jgi:hypothetical protein
LRGLEQTQITEKKWFKCKGKVKTNVLAVKTTTDKKMYDALAVVY